MIDLWWLAANCLWIFGLSVLLAGFSYCDWLARVAGRRRRDLANERSFRIVLASGILLTCVGLGLGQADWWWLRTILVALGLVLAWRMIQRPIAKR